MFETLERFPVDPILGLISAYAADHNPRKIDLGVGVYKDEQGRTPILAAVKAAERIRLEVEDTKTYYPQAGNPVFNREVQRLLFGDDSKACAEQRVHTVQTPGGSGAVKVGAMLLGLARPGAKILVSDPTWINHKALLANSDLDIGSYPYYDSASNRVRFDDMKAAIAALPPRSYVLLQGCCHNPSGADLTLAQWRELAALLRQHEVVPFVDIAYHGLAIGVDEDVAYLRLLAVELPELVVAYSCSKNFGLYRERVGAVSVVGATRDIADNALSQILGVARRLYSVPPAHGQTIVGTILSTPQLRASWLAELTEMRERLNGMRREVAAAINARQQQRDFGFIAGQYGMFSFLGLSVEQIRRLRNEFSIYMVETSRINVAGLNPGNIDYFADAVAAVL
ncbi:MAG: aspartate/tyrosine/aromatic aminotransferase [Gammaproteobacteria bacterium]|nr:aspartate/tyrosine/aromatic aminotransferase [Gammaproteobacteria bacterium]